jgi:hypothetical protein
MQLRLLSLLLVPVVFVPLASHLKGDEGPYVVVILADDLGYSDFGLLQR